MTKLLFVCGSPRNAATQYAIQQAIKGAQNVEGVECTLWELKGKKIAPCIGCNACVNQNKLECLLNHDDMDQMAAEFFQYDGFFIASPIYEMGITPQLSAFFSRFRWQYLLQKEDVLRYMYKPGAAMAVGGTRNGGQEMVIQAIHGFYHTYGLPVVNGGLGIYGGAAVWSQDRRAQGAAEDSKGMESAELLGKKLALTAVALKAAQEKEEGV